MRPTEMIQENPHASARPGLLVLGRGGVGSAVISDMQKLCEKLAQRLPSYQIAYAFVDRQTPSLPEALSSLQDAPSIAILPTFLPDEAALRRWLHKVSMRWLNESTYQGKLNFLPPLSASEHLLEAVALHIHNGNIEDMRQAMQEVQWERDPVAWNLLPTQPYQVLWCVGPRCAAKGAVSLWPQLGEIVRSDPALKNKFNLLQTSCQFPCNRGPLMQIHPGGNYFGPLQAESIGAILRDKVALT